MSLTLRGKLSRKLSVESGTSKAGKDWQKQSFLVDTGSQYNPEVCFQLFGEEKMVALNQIEIGEKIEVFFNLSSREYNNKYYHNIDAWKINKLDNTDNIDTNGDENDAPF